MPDGTQPADLRSVSLPASVDGGYDLAVDPARDLVVTVAFHDYRQADPFPVDADLLAAIYVDGVYRTGKSVMVQSPVAGPEGYPSATSTIHTSEW